MLIKLTSGLKTQHSMQAYAKLCTAHDFHVFLERPVYLFSLCISISTLTVCLKWASFIWQHFTDASSWLNCSATEELISALRVGQIFRLRSFSSGHFFDETLLYREYLSFVPVTGCVPVILSFSGNSVTGDFRSFTHSKLTWSSFLAAKLRLSMVGAHSLPSFGWKNNCFVLLFVCRATCPATSEM